MRTCTVENCENPYLAKGLCRAHYLRKWKHGRLHKIVMRGEPLVDRIMAKTVKFPDGCWVFMGKVNGNSYGMTTLDNGIGMSAHKAYYEAIKGPVPKGLELDHLCRNRRCVNPDHMEPVTHQVNCQRGTAGHDHKSRKRNTKGQFLKKNTYDAMP